MRKEGEGRRGKERKRGDKRAERGSGECGRRKKDRTKHPLMRK